MPAIRHRPMFRFRPIFRFATLLALLFVFVFAATWVALAQTATDASPPDQAPASGPESDVEVNLDILDSLRRDDAPAPQKKETAPKAATDLPELATTPQAPSVKARPVPVPPPLPDTRADNLPPPIVPDDLAVPSPNAAAPLNPPAASPPFASFKDRRVRLLFDTDSPALTFEAAEELTALAQQLVNNPVRLAVHAYAGQPDRPSSENRRLALKRALSVRGYLVELNIDALRIDLHPEGSAPDSDSPDRVDILFYVP